jgi:hypothetical protein
MVGRAVRCSYRRRRLLSEPAALRTGAGAKLRTVHCTAQSPGTGTGKEAENGNTKKNSTYSLEPDKAAGMGAGVIGGAERGSQASKIAFPGRSLLLLDLVLCLAVPCFQVPRLAAVQDGSRTLASSGQISGALPDWHLQPWIKLLRSGHTQCETCPQASYTAQVGIPALGALAGRDGNWDQENGTWARRRTLDATAAF